MMVVGYNGIQFQAVGLVNYRNPAGFPYDFSDIRKSGALLKGPSLWATIIRHLIHRKKGRQNVWSTIIIKLSGPYICWTQDWQIAWRQFDIFFDLLWTRSSAFIEPAVFSKSFSKFKSVEGGKTYPKSHLWKPFVKSVEAGETYP